MRKFSEGNFCFLIKNWWKWDKKNLMLCAIRVFVIVVLPLIFALVPKILIDLIQSGASEIQLIVNVAVLTGLMAVFSWIEPVLSGSTYMAHDIFNLQYNVLAFRHILYMNYAELESYGSRKANDRAKAFCGMGAGAKCTAGDFCQQLVGLLSSAVGVISYTAILTTIKPILIVIIIVSAIVEFIIVKMFQNMQFKVINEQSDIRT